MKFLVNPKTRRSKSRRKRPIPKGYKSWPAYMDHIRSFKKGEKKMAKRRSRKRSRKASHRRRKRSRSVLKIFNPPARRRRSVSRKRSHRRRYHRNPPAFRIGNFPMMIFNGAIDATEILVGKGLTRLVPQTFGLPRDGAFGLGVQVVSALVVGWLGTFISPNASKMLLAGGLTAPVEDGIKGLNIPFLAPLLGNDVVEISSYDQIGDYGNKGPFPGSGDLMGSYDYAGAQQY